MGNANPKFVEALGFAVKAHGAVAQARKGTSFPYVVHPIRVAEILDRFGYGDDVVVAGLFHDTIEDADITADELTSRYGARVTELVRKASEPDKSLEWRPRKTATIESASREDDLEALAVVAADKLDNVRALKETLRARGAKETWNLFNADRASQHWYYRTLTQTLLDREPTNLLFRTLDAEVQELFPDDRRQTRFFAGKAFGTPHDARAYLADPIRQWRPDYSAYELAHAWIGGEVAPAPVDALLREALGEYELVEGFFEKETPLTTRGRPSQTDLLLVLRNDAGLAVAAIEGKAREPFGPRVEEWDDGSEGKNARLTDLRRRLDLTSIDVTQLRYQLLHRTVAALIEAERYGTSTALMIVHAFADAPESFADFTQFLEALGLDPPTQGKLSPPKELGDRSLRLGWAAT